METKKCIKCGQIKDVCEFTKDKNKKDGLSCYCKICKKFFAKKDYEKNFIRISKYQEKYYIKNGEEIKKRVKKDYLEKQQEKLSYQKKYYEDNIEKKLKYAKIYRNINRDKRNEYENTRKKTDPIYKLKHLVRNRINKFLKAKKLTKRNTTFKIVGCSPEELKIHLEKKFTENMSWNNQGKWHIDHIIPLSIAKTEEELYKLCHFTNLQPMWGLENIRKGKKIV